MFDLKLLTSLSFVLAPLLISWAIGHLFLGWMPGGKNVSKERLNGYLHWSLAGGLGLGISSAITFFSFVFLGHWQRDVVIAVHLILLTLLLLKRFLFSPAQSMSGRPAAGKIFLSVILLSFIVGPLWVQSQYYPYGGWDAWSCWNFKAKSLLLGGDHWKNIFHPALWRASPHYPLLLPLINVWGWSFVNQPLNAGPQVVAILFTLLTAGLIGGGLYQLTRSPWALVAVLLPLTLPFYLILAVSQYCDIVLGYFVLGGLVCLLLGKSCEERKFFWLGGTFIGFLSFSKPEGMIAAILLTALGIPYVLAASPRDARRKTLLVFLTAVLIAALPAIAFKLLYSPGNQTFVNGFFSPDKPVTAFRLKFILAYLSMELISPHWRWTWVLLAWGALLGVKNCRQPQIRIVPLFVILYLLIIVFYCFTNTYFEIKWWMGVTLNRILFSLLPIVIFWVFYALWEGTAKKKDT